MPWLRTGFWLGADYRRILTSDVKQTIRDGELEEKQSFLCLKQSFLRDVSHKTTKKSSRKIVRDHSRQCPVQYWGRIGPAIEQSVGLILVTGPLSRVINIYIHVIFCLLLCLDLLLDSHVNICLKERPFWFFALWPTARACLALTV